MRIRVYTDGACSGNPGPGGWAAIFTVADGYKQLSGHNINTTNNRMELTAAIEALKHLSVAEWARDADKVDLHSDSAYVVNAINNKWVEAWSNNDWLTQQGKPVKNQDLWKELGVTLRRMERAGVDVQFIKVKGHAGNTFNEMVDKLAVSESVTARQVAAAMR